MEERLFTSTPVDMCNPSFSNEVRHGEPLQPVAEDEARDNVQHEEETTLERESDSGRQLSRTHSENNGNIPFSKPLEHGVCGLQNLGNTCFMNAGLQCLINMPAICQHFFKSSDMQNTLSQTQETNLTTPFRNLLLEVWGNKRADFRPETFKSCLAIKFSQFEGYRQHDCQEFLALLLSSLHDEMRLKKMSSAANGEKRVSAAGEAQHRDAEGLEDDVSEGVLSSNVGRVLEEDVDEDELRKIEHKNQDEVNLHGSTQQLMDFDEYQQMPPPLFHINQNAASADYCGDEIIDRDISCDAAVPSGGVVNAAQGQACVTLERKRQISPSNVMKKMKLDSDEFGVQDVNDSKNAFTEDSEIHEGKLGSDFYSKFKGLGDETEGVAMKGGDKKRRRTDVKKAVEKKTESIIAQTFQGQFKNTVCCEHCKSVSTTFEPFMYLPVPLPGALDRNFHLLFLTSDPDSPRYLVEVKGVNKHGTVGNLREKLMKQLKSLGLVSGEDQERRNVVLALGKTSACISPNQPNSGGGVIDMFLDQDSNSLIHLPECVPPMGEGQQIAVATTTTTTITTSSFSSSSSIFSSGSAMASSGTLAHYYAFCMETVGGTGAGSVGGGGSGERERERHGEEEDERNEERQEEEHGERERDSDQHLNGNLNSGGGPTSKQQVCPDTVVSSWKQCCICLDERFEDDLVMHKSCGVCLCMDCYERTKQQQQSQANQQQQHFLTGSINEGEDDQMVGCVTVEDMDAQPVQSCAPSAGDVNADTIIVKCPMCNMPADGNDQFVQLGQKATARESTGDTADTGMSGETVGSSSDAGSNGGKRGTRLMMLSVNYRFFNCETERMERVDWPRVLYVMDCMSKADLFATVSKHCIPSSLRGVPFSLFKTENSALKCSRCYKAAKSDADLACACSVIGLFDANQSTNQDASEEDLTVHFIPGDSLCIQLNGVLKEDLADKFASVDVVSDESWSLVSRRREHSSRGGCLSLEECIEAFTAEETLEEQQDRWWCERCACVRRATKQITLSQLPETLVIYLKRFHFHNATMSSFKLDNEVTCPLLLNIASSPPSSAASLPKRSTTNSPTGSEEENNLYQLQSCVCHVGQSVDSGHYTAYARNALSGTWYYFNDSAVSNVECPPWERSKDIYILFYQRSDCSYTLDPPPPPPPAPVPIPATTMAAPIALPFYSDAAVTTGESLGSREDESLSAETVFTTAPLAPPLNSSEANFPVRDTPPKAN